MRSVAIEYYYRYSVRVISGGPAGTPCSLWDTATERYRSSYYRTFLVDKTKEYDSYDHFPKTVELGILCLYISIEVSIHEFPFS